MAFFRGISCTALFGVPPSPRLPRTHCLGASLEKRIIWRESRWRDDARRSATRREMRACHCVTSAPNGMHTWQGSLCWDRIKGWLLRPERIRSCLFSRPALQKRNCPLATLYSPPLSLSPPPSLSLSLCVCFELSTLVCYSGCEPEYDQ